MSRIGRKPINIPKEVKVEYKDQIITIEGPRGKVSRTLFPEISLEISDSSILVKRNRDGKKDRALQGLSRALVLNMVKGVTDGYVKELEIIGIGFKAQILNNTLVMQLGYSHPVNFPIPEGIKIETPKPTQIVVRGIDKEKVGEVGAEIRAVDPPEPYKGKGIRYLNERVKKKVGKAQAAGGK
ncbi:MAG: 50S ribosomal protein L6 [Candidatus Omnitrophota bacterium]|nr:50S ribosomal protein L6 [Candidatus Omnitrophota bacterium]